jgi:hypothetical protein
LVTLIFAMTEGAFFWKNARFGRQWEDYNRAIAPQTGVRKPRRYALSAHPAR